MLFARKVMFTRISVSEEKTPHINVIALIHSNMMVIPNENRSLCLQKHTL